eukprot:TRINITY_DN2294_c0_g1_i1.p1 TRINITY_DN2294_c0_g1~~TRINITY_DN2294_c0_g1_i1.p1  ORF type:complete len:223 (+),score=19.91 TRINITY_DN2294_c0_g1_i1:52-669(+)
MRSNKSLLSILLVIILITCSIMLKSDYSQIRTTADGQQSKVAIIGSGIAGSSAAWSLTRSNYQVTEYERKKSMRSNKSLLSILLVIILITCSIMLKSDYSQIRTTADGQQSKVAIIGSGIAGSSAAWSLTRSNYHVTVYEKNSVVGGNAKTHQWSLSSDDSLPQKLTTGLSVLAWPSGYFHNYEALLEMYSIRRDQVIVPYIIST